ncbi:hypothetical protein HDU76_006906, partial [Blyttiomyces sp. JEL0837]
DVSDNCLAPFPAEFNNHTKFTLTPQKRICQKWSSQNDPAPTNTPIVTDPFRPHTNDVIIITKQQGDVSTIFETVTNIATSTATGTGETKNPVPTIETDELGANKSDKNLIVTVAAASGGSLFVIVVLALFVSRHRRRKNNQVFVSKTPIHILRC